MNNKLLLSDETKVRLNEGILSNMQKSAKNADMIYSWIKKIELLEQKLKGHNAKHPSENHTEEKDSKNEDISNIQNVCEYSLLISLLWLDIGSAYRIYLNAIEKYEVLYAGKQLVVTINEGYKKIYHYITIDKNGNINRLNRETSFWVKEVGGIVKEKTPFLTEKYDNISSRLDDYLEQNMEGIKQQRVLAIHYGENKNDKKISNVYEMLINLDIEEISKKVIPFMEILTDMIHFCTDLFTEYNKLLEQKNNNFWMSHHDKLEDFKNRSKDPKVVEMLSHSRNY
ncbi:hypothetical protein [Alistipes sp.]